MKKRSQVFMLKNERYHFRMRRAVIYLLKCTPYMIHTNS